MIGERFGALTVQSVLCLWDRREYASCKCSCGNAGLVLVSQLLDKSVDSCGAMPRVESPAKIKADWEKAQIKSTWKPTPAWKLSIINLLRKAIKYLS